MTPRLSILPGDQADDVDLDLLELGAVSDASDRAHIEAMRSGPLAKADRELANARAFFAAHATPLPGAPPRRRTFVRWAPLVAFAAALLLVFGLTVGRGPAVRPMGGDPSPLPVRLTVVRDGQTVVPPWTFAPQDELRVELTSPYEGFLDVWTRQADGSVSELVLGLPVHADEAVELPGAIQLDPYPEEEWLMMRITESPTAPGALRDLRHEMLDVGHSFALEVTRSR